MDHPDEGGRGVDLVHRVAEPTRVDLDGDICLPGSHQEGRKGATENLGCVMASAPDLARS